MGLGRGGKNRICQHCLGFFNGASKFWSRTFLPFGYGQIQIALQRIKIEQRDSVAPLLEDGTDVIAVLLMVFNGEFYFLPLFHWGWK